MPVKRLFAILLSLLLAACGGSSSSPNLGAPGEEIGGNADTCCQQAVDPGSYCQCPASGENCVCHGEPSISCSPTAGTCSEPGPAPTATPAPGPTPAPAPSTSPGPGAKGTIYLLTEAGGFAVSDFHGLPAGLDTWFDRGVVIAPNDPDPTRTETIWAAGEADLKKAGITRTERWLSIYFGTDGLAPLPDCHTGSGKTAQECADAIVQYVDSHYRNASITGLFFDDEEGKPDLIVPGMEQAAPRLLATMKLGWTLGLNAMMKPSPGDLSTRTQPWDVSLGQAYTNTTQDLYESKGCNAAPAPANDPTAGFWGTIETRYSLTRLRESCPACSSDHAVPMVCGSGNCQEPPACSAGPRGGNCIDERLSKSAIRSLLENRPAGFPYANFAIWYGTIAPVTSGCPNSGYSCVLTTSCNSSADCDGSDMCEALGSHDFCANGWSQGCLLNPPAGPGVLYRPTP